MEEQALGVELITPVRCYNCGKVLAGDEYDRLSKEAIREANNSVPMKLSHQEREELVLKFIKSRTEEIFEKLNIKRWCCKMNIQYKRQLLVGAPSPEGNTVIDRQNMMDKGMKRSITRIELSTPSRVPGKSGFSMTSLPGEEDYGEEWKSYIEKSKRELYGPQVNYSKVPTKLISSEKLQLPVGFNIKNTAIPVTNIGNTTTIKPKYLDMLTEVNYVSNSAGGPEREDIQLEIVSSFSQMQISETEGTGGIDGNDYRDIMDYEVTAPALPDTFNHI